MITDYDDIILDTTLVDALPTEQQPESVHSADYPGRQIGLYSDISDKDVRQMVRTLNNAEDELQSNRG